MEWLGFDIMHGLRGMQVSFTQKLRLLSQLLKILDIGGGEEGEGQRAVQDVGYRKEEGRRRQLISFMIERVYIVQALHSNHR